MIDAMLFTFAETKKGAEEEETKTSPQIFKFSNRK